MILPSPSSLMENKSGLRPKKVMQEKLSPNSASVEVKAVDYLGRRYTSHYTKMEGVGSKTRWRRETRRWK